MKIIILSTGRGLRPEFIDELRTTWGLQGSDQISLVAGQRSFLPLPVTRHLVLGPHPRLGGDRATDQRVHGQEATPARTVKVPLVKEATATGRAAVAKAVTATTSANTTAHLPVVHPRRVRQALVWRTRRLKRAAVRRARRLKLATSRGTRISPRARIQRHPLYRKLRPKVNVGISLRFAAGCLRSRKIHDLARVADLVVALDTASQRGAWTLAQRVSGPDVVVGVPAAKRLVDQRRR